MKYSHTQSPFSLNNVKDKIFPYLVGMYTLHMKDQSLQSK